MVFNEYNHRASCHHCGFNRNWGTHFNTRKKMLLTIYSMIVTCCNWKYENVDEEQHPLTYHNLQLPYRRVVILTKCFLTPYTEGITHTVRVLRPFWEIYLGISKNEDPLHFSTFLNEQLFRTIQFLLNHAETSPKFNLLSHYRGGRRLCAKESLDFGPQPVRLQPQHQSQLEGGDQVGVYGQLPHALTDGPLLHTQVNEGPPQAAGLAGRQVKELLSDVLQEFLGDEQFGAAQGAVWVFGFSQAGFYEFHYVFQDGLLHRVIKQVFIGGRQVTGVGACCEDKLG